MTLSVSVPNLHYLWVYIFTYFKCYFNITVIYFVYILYLFLRNVADTVHHVELRFCNSHVKSVCGYISTMSTSLIAQGWLAHLLMIP
jgi:hypothetical protein